MSAVVRGTAAKVGLELQNVKVLATGLEFPEGPMAMPDGSVILGEVQAGSITRIDPSGTKERIMKTGGGPNGLAVGPDGCLYVCNNGLEGGGYTGGRIERVDLSTGTMELLYDSCDGAPLSGPNDIVFDAHGGFYFTDFGNIGVDQQDRGAIFYAKADGSHIAKMEEHGFQPMGPLGPNGIALSDDGTELYFVETFTCRLFSRRILSPGVLDPEQSLDESFVYGSNALEWFDGFAVDSAGNVCIGTLRSGVVTVVPTNGEDPYVVQLPEEVWDSMPTNMCFGGPDRSTLYITLSGSGTLISAQWPRPGISLVHEEIRAPR